MSYNIVMFRTNALGCRTLFLYAERSEPYTMYGEKSTAIKNNVLRQEPRGATSFAGWQAGGAWF